MNPRPLHRSRLFLLGIPGLIFLLWLWLGTRHTRTTLVWSGPKHAIAAVVEDGVLQLSWTTLDNPATMSFSGASGANVEKVPPGQLFPPAISFQTPELRTPGFHQRLLNLAHWLLILIYLLLWLTPTIAWHRRKNRLANNAPIANSAPT